MNIKGSEKFPAPNLPEAEGGALSLKKITHPVDIQIKVLVPVYEGMKDGDTVQPDFRVEPPLGPLHPQPSVPVTEVKPMLVRISTFHSMFPEGATLVVTYDVWGSGDAYIGKSNEVRVKIVP